MSKQRAIQSRRNKLRTKKKLEVFLMTIEDELKAWETCLKREEAKFKNLSKKTREQAYSKDIAPYHVIIRALRYKGGMPICCGAADCPNCPSSKCANGHEICQAHVTTCFHCTSAP